MSMEDDWNIDLIKEKVASELANVESPIWATGMLSRENIFRTVSLDTGPREGFVCIDMRRLRDDQIGFDNRNWFDELKEWMNGIYRPFESEVRISDDSFDYELFSGLSVGSPSGNEPGVCFKNYGDSSEGVICIPIRRTSRPISIN